jgi:methionyl-tRNA formyltransferase
LEAVVTQPDRPAGRDLKLRPSPVKVAAQELERPVLQPAKIRAPEALAQLVPFRPDVIVVAAYGQILPKAVLSLPPLGCVNIHASLLPRHRGAAPVQAAILAGDSETGITIMQMDEGLDTGDMLLKVTTPIAPDETAGSLHDRLALLAPAPLLDCLERLARGTATSERQDPALATYAPKLDRSDGEIDWSKSALEIERRIRAMTPWPGAFTVMPLRNAGVIRDVERSGLAFHLDWFPAVFGFNEEVDLDGVFLGYFFDHIVQNLAVMLPDPVTVKFTRHLDDHPGTVEGYELRLGKPGVISLPGHFIFNEEKDLLPNLC